MNQSNKLSLLADSIRDDLKSLENIRPAIIDQQLFTFLNNVRGFRHVVRHSYDYDLDYRRMLLIVDDIETHYNHLVKKIIAFIEFIQEHVKRIEGES